MFTLDNMYSGMSELIEDDTADFNLTPNECKVCEHCGDAIVETTAGWIHEKGEDGSIGDSDLCGRYDRADIREELEMGEDDALTVEDIEGAGYTLASPGDPTGADLINWVGMTVGSRSAEVQISVGEPRGCFEMRVWQGEDENGKPCIYLSTPHPDDSAPHVRLVHHYNGVYRIVQNGE